MLSKITKFVIYAKRVNSDIFDIIGRFRLKMFFLGEYKKYDLLEASRSGNDIKLMSLLTPLNVNCHASDGRKSTPLHLAAGYNRTRIVQLLLQVCTNKVLSIKCQFLLINYPYSYRIVCTDSE